MIKQADNIAESFSIAKHIILSKLMRLNELNSVEEILKQANIIYYAPGDAAKTGLPDKSVDIVFTYAVLEHVEEYVIHDLTKESKRILKNNGIVYHAIGLHDHYKSFDKKISNVNFLKYPEWLWNFFIKNKISYHNRLRKKHFTDIFESYGAKIKILSEKIDNADLQALKNMKIDKKFRNLSLKDLAIHYVELIYFFE